MPPWLDSAEDVAALATAVIVAVGLVVSAVVAAAAGVIAVWQAKVKPLLTSTQTAAEVAAHESRPNSGKSMRDAIDQQAESIDQQGDLLVEILAMMRTRDDKSDRAHSEIFRRINTLESRKDTRP